MIAWQRSGSVRDLLTGQQTDGRKGRAGEEEGAGRAEVGAVEKGLLLVKTGWKLFCNLDYCSIWET